MKKNIILILYIDINKGIEHIQNLNNWFDKKGVINYIKYQAFSTNKN